MSTPLSWYLRGGYRQLAVWREATGQAICRSVVRPVAFSYSATRRTTAVGNLSDVGKVQAIAPEIASWPTIETLRTWAAAGATVKAALIARGRGPHLLFHEAVPVILEPFSPEVSGFAGDRLVLSTEKFAASVVQTPDLLNLATWAVLTGAEDYAQTALPAPGLTLYAYDAALASNVAIYVYDRTGVLLTSHSATPGIATVTLPSATWYVRVTAETGARPILTAWNPVNAAGAPAQPNCGYATSSAPTPPGLGATSLAYRRGSTTGLRKASLSDVDGTTAAAVATSIQIASVSYAAGRVYFIDQLGSGNAAIRSFDPLNPGDLRTDLDAGVALSGGTDNLISVDVDPADGLVCVFALGGVVGKVYRATPGGTWTKTEIATASGLESIAVRNATEFYAYVPAAQRIRRYDNSFTMLNNVNPGAASSNVRYVRLSSGNKVWLNVNGAITSYGTDLTGAATQIAGGVIGAGAWYQVDVGGSTVYYNPTTGSTVLMSCTLTGGSPATLSTTETNVWNFVVF